MKFWSSITKIIDDDPNHYIAKLVQIGENTQYIKHYKNLATRFTSSADCNNALKIEYSNKFKSKINDAAVIDVDSKLGTYLTVNPNLTKPTFSAPPCVTKRSFVRFSCLN